MYYNLSLIKHITYLYLLPVRNCTILELKYYFFNYAGLMLCVNIILIVLINLSCYENMKWYIDITIL